MQESQESTRTTIRCLLPHTDNNINLELRKIGPAYKVSDARRQILKTGSGVLEFDNHLEMCGEFEKLISFLDAFDRPLHVGVKLTLNHLEVTAVVAGIEYIHYGPEKELIMKVFLNWF